MKYPVIDLAAAADSLPDEHKTLKHRIKQLRDSHSIQTDLTLAVEFIGTMQALKKNAAAKNAGGIAQNAFLALFYSSLLLYVRATKTQHDHRASFDFRAEYNDDQKIKHDVLCDLRDKALAHYGPGGRYVGPAFQKEGVFIPYYEGTHGRIMNASHRLIIQPELISSLQQMTHRALMISERRTQALNQKVVDLVNTTAQQDAELLPLLRQHITDLSTFLGSEEAAHEVMTGSQVGYHRGTVNH